MFTLTRWILITFVLLVPPLPASALPINLGLLQYNNFIPGDAESPGVNHFVIGDLTDVFGLPPEFPVLDALVFTDVSLTLGRTDGTTTVLPLATIAPGFLDGGTDSQLQFAASELFVSATFQATLSLSTFQVSDGLGGGSTFVAASPNVTATLLPSIGNGFLLVNDFALVQVEAEERAPAPVPEPGGTLLLTLLGSGVMAAARRRRGR